MSFPPYRLSAVTAPTPAAPPRRSQHVATPSWRSLRDLRQHQQLSLRRLAEQAGTNAGYLSQLETEPQPTSPHVLAGLSQALDVDPAGWRIRVVLEHEEPA